MAGKLSIGDAWTEAAAFLRRERRVLAPVVLGLLMVPAVVASMVQPNVPKGTTPEPGLWMLVVLAMVLATIVGQMAIVLLATGWRDSVGQAIRRAAARLPVGIMAALLIMIPMLLIVGVIAGGAAFAAGGGAPGAKLGGVSLMLLLVVIAVMLFVMVRLLPLFAVVATGNEGPIAAIRHAFALTRGHFWKLLGFILLLTLAFAVLGMAMGAVVGSIVTLTIGPPDPWSVSLLLLALASGLLQAAFGTLYTAMTARIMVQLEAQQGEVQPTSGT